MLTDLHSIVHSRPRRHLESIAGVGADLVLSRCWNITHADWQPLWHLKALWPADPHDPTGAALAAVRAGTGYRHLGARPQRLDNPEVLVLARDLPARDLPIVAPCCVQHLIQAVRSQGLVSVG